MLGVVLMPLLLGCCFASQQHSDGSTEKYLNISEASHLIHQKMVAQFQEATEYVGQLPKICSPALYRQIARQYLAREGVLQETSAAHQFAQLMETDDPCSREPRRLLVSFPWAGEWDLLDIHVETLIDVADRIFFSEGNVTFHGTPRQLRYQEFLKRYAPVRWAASDKVEYVPLAIGQADMEQAATHQWHLEGYTRGKLDVRINEWLGEEGPEALVYHTDLDQIMRPELAWLLKWSRQLTIPVRSPICLKHLHMIAWWFNWMSPHGFWCGSHSALVVARSGPGIVIQRRSRGKREDRPFLNAGWHLQYFLGEIGNLNKVQSFSHARDRDYQPARIQKMMTIENFAESLVQGHDFLGRERRWKQGLRVNEDLEDLPRFMLANKARFSYLIYPPDF
jgi:hypothetical protein